jgi:hypothetical protein
VDSDKDSALRDTISQMMADGLQTQTEPFPENDRAFGSLVDQLHDVCANDLKAKLVLIGIVDTPYGPDRMRCRECMYYLVHRKWCDLPEIALPVEPDWWCRLWRI